MYRDLRINDVFLYTITKSGYFRVFEGYIDIRRPGSWQIHNDLTGCGHYMNRGHECYTCFGCSAFEGKVVSNWLWLKERDDEKAAMIMLEHYKNKIIESPKFEETYKKRISCLEKELA